MNDLISRQAVYNILDKCSATVDSDAIRMDVEDLPSAQPNTDHIYAELSKAYNVPGLPDEAINIIGDLMLSLDEPSAQPEIIRCKDCKWKQGSECVRFADVRPFPDDFCSRAEQRGEKMDLIDRQAAIDALTEYGNGRAVYIGVEEAVRRIEQSPSAQIQRIVLTDDEKEALIKGIVDTLIKK